MRPEERAASELSAGLVQQPYRCVEAPILCIGLVTRRPMLLSQCGQLVLIGTDAAERVTGIDEPRECTLGLKTR